MRKIHIIIESILPLQQQLTAVAMEQFTVPLQQQ